MFGIMFANTVRACIGVDRTPSKGAPGNGPVGSGVTFSTGIGLGIVTGARGGIAGVGAHPAGRPPVQAGTPG